MERITRISYNSAGWRHPTGEAAGQELKGTYNNLHGFGHEDWLFRNDWVIDGWRYAFIQGVNKGRKTLLKEQTPFDVTLFTVEPDKRRRYVAKISEAEALDDQQATDALQAFREAGWLKLMGEEIELVGGNASALGDALWASHILNVRFRIQNICFLPPDTYAQANDPVQRQNRYQLYRTSPTEKQRRNGRSGSALPPSVQGALRRPVGATIVSPEHAKMQAQLMRELQQENPSSQIIREQDYIDVLVETTSEFHLYEIKSDLSPMTVLRLAIGQLLEYAFYLKNPANKRVTLTAVGRSKLSLDDKTFLDHIRQQHSLPLEYRVVTT